MKQLFHEVEFVEDIDDDFAWAVKWKDTVVCYTDREEKADAIRWALDTASPYFVDEDGKHIPHISEYIREP